MPTRALTLDQWTPLAHKTPIPTGPNDHADTLAPTWIHPDHRRRLDAYKILHAYLDNAARHLITGLSPTDRDQRREYGDADLLVRRVAHAVLGDTTTITVNGATPAPDRPNLPDPPEPPTDDAPDIEHRIHRTAQTRWETTADQAVTEWEAHVANQPAAAARQAWLEAWADDEMLAAKLTEGEHDTVGLGDGIYRLYWSATDGRPVLEIYDPGFYFPVLTDDTTGFPTKVHLAWEFDDQVGTKKVRKVRRLTWELVDLTTAYINPTTGDWPRNDDGTVALTDGDRWFDDGTIGRRYPWQPTDQAPSTTTCLFSDGTWTIDTLHPDVDTFNEDKATWATTDEGRLAHRIDLAIDFIPVVHVPNTPASKEHFGRSVLTIVAQILDDLSASDTDVQAASALAAGPALGLAGQRDAGETIVRPGAIYNLGEGGRMDVLDLSAGLEQLLNVNRSLQERLSINSQVPAEVLGRVEENRPTAGIGIKLRAAPFSALIGAFRLTRDPKHRLLLKMVQRLAQAGGVLPAGPNPTATIQPGPYLPSDLAEVIEQAVKLLQAKGASTGTVLQMLADAGLPVGDLATELDAIRADDTAGAVQVAEATASEQLAAERLGLELPDESTVPAPTIDLGGGGG